MSKDKRTEAEKESNRQYLEALDELGVVGCKHKVVIISPGPDKDMVEWTLMIDQQGTHGHSAVVVAWYKTRKAARIHAKRLRHSLKQLVIR